MVSVLPRASPRAAAFGRKLNFTIAASTACLRPPLTLTVPLMIRETVLAETPASRATIRSVADWRGRGPLLPGVGAIESLDLISSSAVRNSVKPISLSALHARSRGQRLFRLRENSFQFLQCLSLRLGGQHHDEQEAGSGHQSIREKCARGPPGREFHGKKQCDAGADQGVPESN